MKRHAIARVFTGYKCSLIYLRHLKEIPSALHVKSSTMPVYENQGTRVRIVLGESNGLTGQSAPTLPMTILDGKLAQQSTFSHQLNERESAWVYAIKGELTLSINDEQITLSEGQAIAVSQLNNKALSQLLLTNTSAKPAHLHFSQVNL